jgi:hypothetical protein
LSWLEHAISELKVQGFFGSQEFGIYCRYEILDWKTKKIIEIVIWMEHEKSIGNVS